MMVCCVQLPSSHRISGRCVGGGDSAVRFNPYQNSPTEGWKNITLENTTTDCQHRRGSLTLMLTDNACDIIKTDSHLVSFCPIMVGAYCSW